MTMMLPAREKTIGTSNCTRERDKRVRISQETQQRYTLGNISMDNLTEVLATRRNNLMRCEVRGSKERLIQRSEAYNVQSKREHVQSVMIDFSFLPFLLILPHPNS